MSKALDRHGREEDGHFDALAENMGREVHLRDVDKRSGPEFEALEGVAVAVERGFVVGAAGDVVEERRRKLLPR